MKKILSIFLSLLLTAPLLFAQEIPLPEHPRPDFMRDNWINLNGTWDFEFDSLNTGLSNEWQAGKSKFSKEITVPFPWGSELSGVKDEADIAWYRREIKVPENWKSKKTFFTIGASDWETTVWIDGQLLGKHTGGYTPFSFDLTPYVKHGKKQKLVIRVDDARRMFTLYGKQGYGNARGIWQTAYLEARGNTFIKYSHFLPDIDNQSVTIKGELGEAAITDIPVEIRFSNGQLAIAKVTAGQKKFETSLKINSPHLWSLEDPYLYDVSIKAGDDLVNSYYGHRKISVTPLPGTDIPYIAINNEPVYLQLALDQSYHPEGFYTFPTDEFMKNEIVLAKNIGLNGIRTHIKVEVPRKLYWADKLGCLVMADLPNSWGEPDEQMQKASEFTLREMIERDFNHPSIFSWIVFNETWGLKTAVEKNGKKENVYLPKTQYWVASMYYLAKSLDGTRLVEDNSICCGAGHTETDIYSWHQYLPGYKWEEFMSNLDTTTYAGSTYDYEPGFSQGNQPMINSECGNVWGYAGSTGDVDWSYDYHRMMNVFRKHPIMAGWLYTEHHDVINEWNGYWKFDRTPKYTGLGDLASGMADTDFHSLVYLSTGQDITRKSTAGTKEAVELYLSCHTGNKMPQSKLKISYQLKGTDEFGETYSSEKNEVVVDYQPWMQKQLNDLSVKMPAKNGIYHLSLQVQDMNGKVWHTNVMSFAVEGASAPNHFTVPAGSYLDAAFTVKSESVLDGKKANGLGTGSFQYSIKGDADAVKGKNGYLLLELSSRPTYMRDDKDAEKLKDLDYMLGAVADPAKNANAYPMTDTYLNASEVVISVAGKKANSLILSDDPADHRGVLSWFNQNEDGTLTEAGTYGYLVKIPLSRSQVRAFKKSGSLDFEIKTESKNGVAVYGKDFGQYAFDPGVVIY
ncbi:glycoside hydrolase family 2 protein [Jiulongibacter sp. NS-SX5]|uniref:glycoside hydrolase family 2 protein n=1 Tax=Jiulongibacter sp. NS-SX5 TaxID=3463854 RepID=UPI004059552B